MNGKRNKFYEKLKKEELFGELFPILLFFHGKFFLFITQRNGFHGKNGSNRTSNIPPNFISLSHFSLKFVVF